MNNGGTPVSYNAEDLQTENIRIEEVLHQSIPAKDAQALAVAHGNTSYVPYENSPHKIVTLIGQIEGDGIDDTEARIDAFKAIFNAKNANLDIGWAASTRRYNAITVTGCDVRQPGGLAFANFTVTILCQPFGTPTTPTVAIAEAGETATTATYSHDFIGSAEHQLPVITITINTVTGGDGFISITNGANDQGITIVNQTFVATDEIEISTKNRWVKLNGQEIDYLGSFPEFELGSQTIKYADGFTTRNYDIDADYLPLYQ